LSIFAIGDLHLSLSLPKPMDVFGGEWEGYVEKIKLGFFTAGIRPNDTVVLCGDISWAMNISEALEDFRFIDALPGKKLFLKGNHDYWFETAAKTRRFFEENGLKGFEILNNNHFAVETDAGLVALCGTRGWLNPEVGTGKLTDEEIALNKKVSAREVIRLENSLKSASDYSAKTGVSFAETICFLHYPPLLGGDANSEMIAVLQKHGIRRCYFGHVHGKHKKLAPRSPVGGISYSLISADNIGFTPVLVV
jgi:predicted phosphohydrolase